MNKKFESTQHLYYLVSSNGALLEVSNSAGYWEDRGISNIEVLKSAYGLTKKKYKIGYSYCYFKVKTL